MPLKPPEQQVPLGTAPVHRGFAASTIVFIALFLLFCLPFVAAATPALTSLGQVANTLTINGSGFGTRPAPAPIRFETFSGATGQLVAAQGWWSTKNGDLQYSPVTRNDVSRVPGRNVADLSMDSNGTLNLFRDGVGFMGTRKAYVNWWAYLDLTRFDGVPVQVKLLNVLRNTDPTTSDNQYPDQATSLWSDMTSVTSATVARYYYAGGSAPGLNYRDGSGNNSNLFATPGWYNFQIQIDQGTINNANGQTTIYLVGPGYSKYGSSGDSSSTVMQIDATSPGYLDSIKLWQYLQFRTNFTDATTFLNAYAAGYPAGARVNYLNKGYRCVLATGARGTFTTTPDVDTTHWLKISDTPLTVSDTVYIDSVYIDNSWARVELCDQDTWSARTHCEIQPSTAWSDGQVNVTVNRGSFSAGDTVYIYVTNESGTVNSQGVKYKIGAPLPPKNFGAVGG